MTQEQGALLIRRTGDRWRSPEVRSYDNEDALKRTLRESPQLLPAWSKGSVVVEELSVPLVVSVDLAGMSPNGDITLVECKLHGNPEIRRWIIGQILAYAAGLWKMRYDEFERHFSDRINGGTLEAAVQNSLPEPTTWHEHEFRSRVADNLAAGRFTLVIAVDQITDELKRVVPYVNVHTVPEVRFIALEIGYVKDGDVEIVLASTYGEESAREKQASQRRPWSVEAYYEKLHGYGEAVESFVRAIAGFSGESGATLEGGTGAIPSLNARFSFRGEKRSVWRSDFYVDGPSFEVNFDFLRDVVPLETLAECAQILGAIDGVRPRYAGLQPEFRSRPSLPIDPTLLQREATETVQRALATLLKPTP